MAKSNEKFIFIFDGDGIRKIRLNGKLTIGTGNDNNTSDIIIKKDCPSGILGWFELTERGYIYNNASDMLDTWIDLNHLNSNVGVVLKNNTHILLTAKDRNEGMISIFYTEDAERVNSPWKVLNKNEVRLSQIVRKLNPGDCYVDEEEVYIIHDDLCFYQQADAEILKIKRPYSESLTIRIKERIGKEKGKTRRLLKDINLDIHTREMVLVVGGSGAGKTTFVNAVSGYEKADAEIRYKEFNLYKNSQKVRRLVRLVPQFDTLRDMDTVYHTLKDAAMLQLPIEIVKDRKKLKEKLDSILQTFGLEKEKNNFVKKISGGQRKRLSIAVEYLSEPEIFFLDEPDSGLDAGSAEMVMNQVREIVDEEKIAIIISHSPDRMRELYDKILVIAKDSVENCGQMAFYGKIDEALEFFQVEKLEDIVKLINNQKKADYFINKFKMAGNQNG